MKNSRQDNTKSNNSKKSDAGVKTGVKAGMKSNVGLKSNTKVNNRNTSDRNKGGKSISVTRTVKNRSSKRK
jgi:hypothetical protein